MMIGSVRFAAASLLVAVATGCDLPRDPEGTSERVSGGTMRVGISEAPPWTRVAGSEAGGVEVELVRHFARELGAEIHWVQGTEAALLEALENFELDLVIAGLTDDTPWSDRLGLSRAYITTETLVAVPTSAPLPAALDGVEVAVEVGDAAAGFLRRRGAVPVVGTRTVAVVVEDWELAGRRLRPTEFVLERAAHVMATPPGENGWLNRLQRFLVANGTEARRLLESSVP